MLSTIATPYSRELPGITAHLREETELSKLTNKALNHRRATAERHVYTLKYLIGRQKALGIIL